MNDHVALLGPVFHLWIARLDIHLTYLARQRGRRALLCARAGKRIGDLLSAHSGTDRPYQTDLFGISRIAACKAVLPDLEAFQIVHEVTSESLSGCSLGDLARAYLREIWDDSDPRMARLGALTQGYDRDNFRTLLAANDPAARFLRDHLAACRAGLIDWLEERRQDATGFVLVDSGWKGSVQRLLAQSLPGYGFEGLYFGVMDNAPLPDRHGLIFDALRHDPSRPETAFALHRHLVESILEPDAPSVEALPRGPESRQAEIQLRAVAAEQPDPRRDALFIGILDHVRANASAPLDDILASCRAVLPELADRLLYPSRADALALGGKPRSIDFGRDGMVPVLLDDTNPVPASLRSESALWKQGQIALDNPPAKARRLQRMAAGLSEASGYFTSHEGAEPGRPPRRRAAKARMGWAGSVAIVTRTKNRPLLLARAARSVAGQTYDNIQWVVVNDGGDPDPVESLIAASGVDPRRITLIHNARSIGMEAASNLGIRSVDTEFVVIHDDDDSWEPGFLTEMIAFLRRPRAIAAGFDGVICRAWRVSEQIDGDQVIFHRRDPFMPWVSEVPLAQMAVGNFFAPISFLYRRKVYDAIGGYDENLPVLGDWRFNLDFLSRSNIGVLDRYLSHYHHRDFGNTGVYANSVVGGRDLHAQYFSVVTNAILRDPASPPGLIAAVANAHTQRVMEHRFNETADTQRGLRRELETLTRRNDDRPAMSPPQAGSGAKAGPLALPQSELAFLRRAVKETLSRSPLLLPVAHLAGAAAAVIARSPRLRRSLLPAFFRWIPSPPDFDHITYLRRHTKIWATRFNGPGEWLPYHHWLLNFALGAGDRPTLPDPGDASKKPGGKKGNPPSANPQAQRAKSGRPPRP